MKTLFEQIERDASISQCDRYRWSLSRSWGNLLDPWLGFIMLNPSTADADKDDPTIRRCMGFAKRLGYSGIAVRNLFAFRATDPTALLTATDPVGSECDESILDLFREPLVCPVVVAAWGAVPQFVDRVQQVLEMIQRAGGQLHCLGLSAQGYPRHPLYLKANEKPIIYATSIKDGAA